MINGVNNSSINNKINNSDLNKNQVNNMLSYPGYGLNFEAMLKEQLDKKQDGVQFSKHALERVEKRGIEVTSTLMDNINDAVEKARAKGAKDIVIIGEKGAFIVNVPNNVVITTMSGAEMKDNIFTNIDGAVII